MATTSNAARAGDAAADTTVVTPPESYGADAPAGGSTDDLGKETTASGMISQAFGWGQTPGKNPQPLACPVILFSVLVLGLMCNQLDSGVFIKGPQGKHIAKYEAEKLSNFRSLFLFQGTIFQVKVFLWGILPATAVAGVIVVCAESGYGTEWIHFVGESKHKEFEDLTSL